MAYILFFVIVLIPELHTLYVEGGYCQAGKMFLDPPLKTWKPVPFLKTKDALEEYLKEIKQCRSNFMKQQLCQRFQDGGGDSQTIEI